LKGAIAPNMTFSALFWNLHKFGAE